MAQNQQSVAGGFGRRVAPWRTRAASGMQLSVSPPPPPSILKQPGRTPLELGVGLGAVAPSGLLSAPSSAARSNQSLDADWEDKKEDDVTDVYAERATLVFKRDGLAEDETTRELPWPAVRLAPVPPPPATGSSRPTLPAPRAAATAGGTPGPVSLPPWGYDVPWAYLPAASLPPPEYAVPLLVRANRARTLPPHLGVRFAAAAAVSAVLALIAFESKPGQAAILVSATDSRGGPVDRLEVFVDGERTLCNAAPCSVPSRKGLHEVRVNAEGFAVPATQAVAVASGDATAVNFIVGSPIESGSKVGGSQDGVKLTADTKEAEPLPQALRDPVEAKSTPSPVLPVPVPVPVPAPAPARDVKATPGLPAYPAPTAPAPKAAPSRGGVGGARGDGYLNINSIPASACFLDGKPLGSTPRLSVSVSAGSHTVKFLDSDRGSTKTVVIKVGVGETKLAVARL